MDLEEKFTFLLPQSFSSFYFSLPQINGKLQVLNNSNNHKHFTFSRTCNSCDALASPLQALPPPVEGWYQPLHTAHMPPNNSSAHQIYQCSSECSDHSRTSHSNPAPTHNQPLAHHQHSHNPHTHHHSHTHTVGGGNDTMRSESSQENGKSSSHRCHSNKLNRFPEIMENDTKSLAASSCTYEVLGEPRNCSDCCSSREGDTCSCSEGSCLYAEAGEPGMPPHMTSAGLTSGPKLLTQQNN